MLMPARQSPTGDFWSALRFATLAALPSTALWFAGFALAASLGVRYTVLAGLTPIALWTSLRAVAESRNRLGSAYYTPVFPIHRQVLLYSLTVAGVNAAFSLVTGPSSSGLAALVDTLLTPLWWVEIPFFGMWLSLNTGADNHTAAMDTLLFLSAHKRLAEKLVSLLWLPGALAGFLLPPDMLLPLAVAFWFVCPGLVFATFLHPGDSGGTGRPLSTMRKVKFGIPVTSPGVVGTPRILNDKG
jgi:hypothetical protein